VRVINYYSIFKWDGRYLAQKIRFGKACGIQLRITNCGWMVGYIYKGNNLVSKKCPVRGKKSKVWYNQRKKLRLLIIWKIT